MSQDYVNTVDNFDSWAPRLYKDFINLMAIHDISPSAAHYFYICFIAMNLNPDADEEDIRDFVREIHRALISELQRKKEEKEQTK